MPLPVSPPPGFESDPTTAGSSDWGAPPGFEEHSPPPGFDVQQSVGLETKTPLSDERRRVQLNSRGFSSALAGLAKARQPDVPAPAADVTAEVDGRNGSSQPPSPVTEHLALDTAITDLSGQLEICDVGGGEPPDPEHHTFITGGGERIWLTGAPPAEALTAALADPTSKPPAKHPMAPPGKSLTEPPTETVEAPSAESTEAGEAAAPARPSLPEPTRWRNDPGTPSYANKLVDSPRTPLTPLMPGEEPDSASVALRKPSVYEFDDLTEMLDDDHCLRPPRVAVARDFRCRERARLPNGQNATVNSVEGLELHTNILSKAEQERLVDFVKDLERRGHANELRGRTFTAPRKWMKGKGRVTMQFGCVYNYATDSQGRAPGILTEEDTEPLPPLLQSVIRRLIRWKVLPADKEPDSAIINLYSEDDCIPPHIDHHDFTRPFCTISLLSEQAILFGARIGIVNPGEFDAPFKLSLPTGSVLILKGNAADVAKHCVPAVTADRISITLRRMQDPFRKRMGLDSPRTANQPGRLPARIRVLLLSVVHQQNTFFMDCAANPGTGCSHHVVSTELKLETAFFACPIVSDAPGPSESGATDNEPKMSDSMTARELFKALNPNLPHAAVGQDGNLRWREHPYWKDKYCETHDLSVIGKCCSCTRFESKASPLLNLGDGRKICVLCCGKDNLIDTQDCQKLYDDILAFFAKLDMRLRERVPMMLVDFPALNEAAEKEGQGHSSECRGLTLAEIHTVPVIVADGHGDVSFSGMSSFGVGRRNIRLTRECEVTAILVLYGLPRLLTGSILAHECMHAWLRLNHARFSTRLELQSGAAQATIEQVTEKLSKLGVREIKSQLDRRSVNWKDEHAVEKSELVALLATAVMKEEGAKKEPPKQTLTRQDSVMFTQSAEYGEFVKHQIQTDRSPVYGEGFRLAWAAYEKHGLERLLDHVSRTAELPK
eukprot:gene8469-10063_t